MTKRVPERYFCKPMPSQKILYVAYRREGSDPVEPVKKIWTPSRDHSAFCANIFKGLSRTRRFERISYKKKPKPPPMCVSVGTPGGGFSHSAETRSKSGLRGWMQNASALEEPKESPRISFSGIACWIVPASVTQDSC